MRRLSPWNIRFSPSIVRIESLIFNSFRGYQESMPNMSTSHLGGGTHTCGEPKLFTNLMLKTHKNKMISKSVWRQYQIRKFAENGGAIRKSTYRHCPVAVDIFSGQPLRLKIINRFFQFL